MSYLVLEMRERSGYGDSEHSYDLPTQYLKQFEPALKQAWPIS
jgi:hypothetical protein